MTKEIRCDCGHVKSNHVNGIGICDNGSCYCLKFSNSNREYCENCKKEITKEMKESQQVIYANAEHTLTGEDDDFCDPMFSGVFCCQNCYNEISGINKAYKKGKDDANKEFIDFLLMIDISQFRAGSKLYDEIQDKIRELDGQR